MKRILVVDDEPFMQQLLKDILEEEGLHVLLASGGRAMMALLRTEIPDLILLDVMMPDGNGEEALRMMREQPQLRDIPVIMMSAGLARHQLKDEQQAFLGKPFELDDLLRVIGDLVGPADAPGPA